MPRTPGGERGAAIPLGHALALGVLQGPSELLPISSSGHLTLLPWLAHWDWPGVDPELRKGFEVTLHGGTAVALVFAFRDDVIPTSARRTGLLALSVAPAALLGYLLERPIEQRLGTPPSVAVGLLVGGLALALSDEYPQTRGRDEVGARDALWLGLAQACALHPGVSRGGATLSAARIRGFKRGDAVRLSRQLALPVIIGAAVLKGARARARGIPWAVRPAFMVGALASFASTVAAGRCLSAAQDNRPLVQYAAYRILLAAAVLARWRAAARSPALNFDEAPGVSSSPQCGT
jgi:undecaprenyl-diphosphatase